MREYGPAIKYEGRCYPHNYRSLISGKTGNSNTLKITEKAGKLLIALKRSRNPVFTDRQIFERYNEVEIPEHNAGVSHPEDMWKPLKSLRSLVRWFNRPEIVQKWFDAVYGEPAARQRFDTIISTDLAGCRDARWEGEGSRLNLYYRDESGKIDTCTVYEVIDTYSEALLGYWISDRENCWQQYHAFRMGRTEHAPEALRDSNRQPEGRKNEKDAGVRESHQPYCPPGKSKQSAVENHRKRFGQIPATGVAAGMGIYRPEHHREKRRQQTESRICPGKYG